MKEEELLEKAYKLAYKYEAERGSCPQCVLSAIIETLEINEAQIIKTADGLAGGVSLSSDGTCGALSGGIMALGVFFGRTYEEFSNNTGSRKIFYYTKKLLNKFRKEYGQILCKDVQKKLFGRSFKLSDKKEYSQFEKQGAHVDKCPKVAGNVARWTLEIILKHHKKTLKK
ncbi:MAG: C-GCAxxG-C-C family protein [Candidatus Thermoplasmatota archaeon]